MATVKTQQDVLTDISEKLDSILGFMAIRGIETDAGAVVARLTGLGMTQKAIARVAGLSEKAVEHRIARLKKSKPKKAVNKSGKKPTIVPSHEPPSATGGESDEAS